MISRKSFLGGTRSPDRGRMHGRFRPLFHRLGSACIAAFFFFSYGIAPTQIVPAIEEAPDGSPKLVSLKFSNAPLDQVIDFYSDLTDRTIIKNPAVNGNITLKGRGTYTPVEAQIAIESALNMINVALVPMGERFLKVVQIGAATTEGMEIHLGLPAETFPDTDKLVMQVITLEHLEAAEITPVLDQLKHQYGKIQRLERTNSLLIYDTERNLQRMLEVIDYLDQPIPIKVEIFLYELKFIPPSEVASKLNEFIAESQAQQKPRRTGAAARTPTRPARGTPPGVIRGRTPRTPATPVATQTAADLAERGIIQGEVKIVPDDRTGILFIISEPVNDSFFKKIITVLDRPVDPEFIVRLISLEYAKAADVASILNDFIGAGSSDAPTTPAPGAGTQTGEARSRSLRDFVRQRAEQRQVQQTSDEASKFGRLSPETKILSDERTNAIMLMGQKGDIAALEEIIDQLDIMLGQVLIEAVILEVNLSDDLTYGIDWLQRSYTLYNEEKVGPGGGGLTVRQPVAAFGGGTSLGDTDGFIDGSQVTRATADGFGAGLTYFTTLFDLNIDAVIRLAAGARNVRILSTPVILTADNEEAQIIVGEERPVVNTTSTTTAGSIRSSFEYRSIGINLMVTPRINPARFVVMDINQAVDDVGEDVFIDGNPVPTIINREFSSHIAVGDGETIILGGLVSTDRRETTSKVPLLGDIPILGSLFRFSAESEARRELMVLITPHVMMTPEEIYLETSRLHNNTQLHKAGWKRGWSDSKLAAPSAEEIQEEKKQEKERRK